MPRVTLRYAKDKSILLCAVLARPAPQFTRRGLPVIISESFQAPGWLNTFFCAAAISHFRTATMHHTIPKHTLPYHPKPLGLPLEIEIGTSSYNTETESVSKNNSKRKHILANYDLRGNISTILVYVVEWKSGVTVQFHRTSTTPSFFRAFLGPP